MGNSGDNEVKKVRALLDADSSLVSNDCDNIPFYQSVESNPVCDVENISSSLKEKSLEIDFCFRLNCIIFCELLRLLLNLVFAGYIMMNNNEAPDQSFYLLTLIS